MPKISTVGKILLKSHIPTDMHAQIDEHALDAKGLSNFFSKLSDKSPEVYKKTVSDLTRLGFEVSTRQGSSVGLSDLVSPVDKEKYFKKVEAEAEAIEKSNISKAEKDRKISELYYTLQETLNKDILAEGLKNNKTLAKVILSGSRGSPTQYRQTVTAPVLVADAKGKPMTDFAIKSSFAEGLTLPEYLAHSYTTRKGMVGTKLAVADAGYLSKQLGRATMTVKVEEHDCGTDNGIECSTTDKDSIGAYLAHPAGDYKKNNEITNKMLGDLANKKISSIIVRSPITCQSSKKFHVGAVCQLCIGKRERGGNPDIGEYVGLSASTTLGERLAQGTLNSKHQGSSAQKSTAASGFKLVNQLFNIPDTFKGKAALAFHDGEVTMIKPAAQGGHYIMIGKEEHYVPAGYELKVKQGQHVEAGDILSEGIPDPSEVVKYKGIGEGRKYFTSVLKSTFQEGGMPINRRNFEIISKAAIDHVRVNNPEGIGDVLPNQIASYQAIEKGYKPRSNAKLVRSDLAYNKYLEVPVLHYTIGTRITKSIIENLKKHKIESVTVHDDEPGFQPEMQRLLDVPAFHDDWMHQLYSTNLERRFTSAVNSASKSSITGASPIAGIAYGVGFGEKKAEMIKEAGNGGDKGCLMGILDENSATKIVKWVEDNVSKDQLHEKGIERCSHITVLYGFSNEIDVSEIEAFLKKHQKPLSLVLKNISIFENPDFDVLKIEVKSDDLEKLNKDIVEEFKDRIDNKFPVYQPHMTLAYLKKGEGKKFEGNAKFSGDVHIFRELVYSIANGAKKYVYSIDKEKKAEEQYLSSGLEFALGQLKEAGIPYALGGDYALRNFKPIESVELHVSPDNLAKVAEELKIAEVENEVEVFSNIETFEKAGFDLDEDERQVIKFACVVESKQKSKKPKDEKDLKDILTRLTLK